MLVHTTPALSDLSGSQIGANLADGMQAHRERYCRVQPSLHVPEQGLECEKRARRRL